MRVMDFAEEALRDLTAIQRWQTQHGSGPAAHRRMAAIFRAIHALVNHPCRYPKGQFAGTRVLTVERHVAIYRVIPDTDDNATAGDVLVIRIFGPGQQRGRL